MLSVTYIVKCGVGFCIIRRVVETVLRVPVWVAEPGLHCLSDIGVERSIFLLFCSGKQ